MKAKRFLFKIFAFLLCIMYPCFFVGCGSNDDQLSFNDLSTFLLDFDTAVRPFFDELKVVYQNHEDAEVLTASASMVTTLSYQMGESFKSFNSIIGELEDNKDSSITLEQTTNSITITDEKMEFVCELNSSKSQMRVHSKSGSDESLIEIIKQGEKKYMAQIVVKNAETDNFAVYQVMFDNLLGTMNIEPSITSYSSILEIFVSGTQFPNVSSYVFKNN